jgi:hypothetical protein
VAAKLEEACREKCNSGENVPELRHGEGKWRRSGLWRRRRIPSTERTNALA